MNTHTTLLKGIVIVIQCAILLVSAISSSWNTAMALSQLYFLAHSIAFLATILDKRRGGISYMIEFFLLFFIALPALLQVSKRVFPWFATFQPEYICGAFGLLALSHLGLQIGHVIFESKSRIHIKESILPVALKNSEAKQYSRCAWIFAIISTLFALLAGPTNLFVARFEVTSTDLSGLSQQFLFICRSLSLLALVMLLFIMKFSQFVRINRQNIYALIIFLPLFFMINYLPALPRFILFGILISLSTAFIDYFSPKIKSLVAVCSIVVLFIVFPTIKSLGKGEFDSGLLEQRSELSAISEYLFRVDFDAFMQVTSTVEYYMNDIGPIRFGENFIGVVFFFIPRAIWPGKPIDTGEIISTSMGYSYTNVASPLPAESLMGFGFMGPFLVFFMLAFFTAKLEFKVKSTKHSVDRLSAMILYAITMGFIVIILRGALNGVAPQFASAFFAFYIANFFLNKKIVLRRI